MRFEFSNVWIGSLLVTPKLQEVLRKCQLSSVTIQSNTQFGSSTMETCEIFPTTSFSTMKIMLGQNEKHLYSHGIEKEKI